MLVRVPCRTYREVVPRHAPLVLQLDGPERLGKRLIPRLPRPLVVLLPPLPLLSGLGSRSAVPRPRPAVARDGGLVAHAVATRDDARALVGAVVVLAMPSAVECGGTRSVGGYRHRGLLLGARDAGSLGSSAAGLLGVRDAEVSTC